MSIIISSKNKPTKKIDRANFDKEDYLQNYIHQNPESIPVYEIHEDKKLLVLAREFPTASGPIDALAIDKDGDIYIVETKLYKNPDKRTVVAQALDYGASLWKHLNDFSEFIDRIEKSVQENFNLSFQDKVKAFFEIEDDQFELIKEAMRRNLADGNLKFVILMDEMEERLKDLIIYVNQNSQFDVYAVQLEYYKYEEYEIMIPKIFGVEVKKSIHSYKGSKRGAWDKDKFFLEIANKFKADQVEKIKKFYYDLEKNSDDISWGSGNLVGSFSPILNKIDSGRSLLSVFTNGRLAIKFSWFNDAKTSPYRDKFKELLNKNTVSLKIPENYKELEVRFELPDWLEEADAIVKAFREL